MAKRLKKPLTDINIIKIFIMAKYITAKQLAEELLKNPNDIICSTTDNFEQGNNQKPKTYLNLRRFKGEIEKKDFRDGLLAINR